MLIRTSRIGEVNYGDLEGSRLVSVEFERSGISCPGPLTSSDTTEAYEERTYGGGAH